VALHLDWCLMSAPRDLYIFLQPKHERIIGLVGEDICF